MDIFGKIWIMAAACAMTNCSRKLCSNRQAFLTHTRQYCMYHHLLFTEFFILEYRMQASCIIGAISMNMHKLSPASWPFAAEFPPSIRCAVEAAVWSLFRKSCLDSSFTLLSYLKVCANIQWATPSEIILHQLPVLWFKNFWKWEKFE